MWGIWIDADSADVLANLHDIDVPLFCESFNVLDGDFGVLTLPNMMTHVFTHCTSAGRQMKKDTNSLHWVESGAGHSFSSPAIDFARGAGSTRLSMVLLTTTSGHAR